MSKQYLITGGAGFIGSNIAKYIQKKDKEAVVWVFDNFSSGHFKNLNQLDQNRLQVVFGDCSSLEDVLKLDGIEFEVIYHMASITDTEIHDQQEVLRKNLEGFRNIIYLAPKENRKTPIIFASSAAVYGNGDLKPLNIYGFSKLQMENLAYNLIKNNPDWSIYGLRFFNVYGVGEEHKGKSKSMIRQIIDKILSGDDIQLFENTLKAERDWVYIKELLSFLDKIWEIDSGIYDCGHGKSESFASVLQICKENLVGYDKSAVCFIEKNLENYQMHTFSKVPFVVENKYSLKDGIRDYLIDLGLKNV